MEINRKRLAPYSRRRGIITVTLECPRSLHKLIKQCAKEDGRTVSAWLRTKIKDLLEKEE